MERCIVCFMDAIRQNWHLLRFWRTTNNPRNNLKFRVMPQYMTAICYCYMCSISSIVEQYAGLDRPQLGRYPPCLAYEHMSERFRYWNITK